MHLNIKRDNLISWIQWPLTSPCSQPWGLAAYLWVCINTEKGTNCNTRTSPLQTRNQFYFYLHFCTHTRNCKASFCSSLCFAVSTFSLAEGLKVITDTVHFISMRTKTAWGTHYHFTEKDRELSAHLFTPLRSDIFHQCRYYCLMRTAFSAGGSGRAGRGRRKKTPTDKEARERGIMLRYELCKTTCVYQSGSTLAGNIQMHYYRFHFLYCWNLLIMASGMQQKLVGKNTSSTSWALTLLTVSTLYFCNRRRPDV